jgi:two-component system response regulator MprA
MGRILVVEDDASVRHALSRALGLEGHEVGTAVDGLAGLEQLQAGPWDVVCLDVSMPNLNGLDLCRRMRAHGDRTPVLMLTARHETTDRVAGLDAGADDYLVKPFDVEELFARIRALMRRAAPERSDELCVGDLRVDRPARRVWRGEHEIVLTKTEFELLVLLGEHAGQVLTREVIFERIWGFTFETTSNSLDVYVGYLRRKTEIEGLPRLIHTVRGVGFVLRDES